MNAKTILRFLWVVVVSGLGGFSYAIAANLLIATGVLDSTSVGTAFGHDMTGRAAIVWMVSIVFSLLSLAVTSRWRYVLLLAPLYAPVAFAIVYVLMNRMPVDAAGLTG